MVQQEPFALIIAGPTASGKTALALCLERYAPIAIINADVGQFYEPLTVGVAKPNWKASNIPHYLFDCVQKPHDISVATYRAHVIAAVDEVWSSGRIPVLVGGSLFYLKSLFFPPRATAPLGTLRNLPARLSKEESTRLWHELEVIDSARAQHIHPHDSYRIIRALDIWKATGKLPSSFTPQFDIPFHCHLAFLHVPTVTLRERIDMRTCQMMFEDNDGFGSWVDEASRLLDTPWEAFISRKNFIGYPEVFKWVRGGCKQEQQAALIKSIQSATWSYARRQHIFWKSLSTSLISRSFTSKRRCVVASLLGDKQHQKDFLKRVLLSGSSPLP